MCRPCKGRSFHRPALMSWARSRIRRRSARPRSAMSRKSRPWSEETTGGIMIARPSYGRLQTGVYELPRDDRRHDEITPGVELGQPGAKLRLVPQPNDQVAAGRRVEAEDRRLE